MADVPTWWQAALLALAAFRTYRLIAEDTILDKPRRWVLRLGSWQDGDGDPPAGYRYSWGEFITCPWCLGFYVSLVIWLAWMIWPHATTIIAVPLAISAAVALVAKLDS